LFYIGFHGRVPAAVETEEIHFLDGLIGGPGVMRYAIARDENARAIIAEAAVNENLFLRIAEERKKLRNLIVGGRTPAIYRDIEEANSNGLGLLAFPIQFLRTILTKVHDSSDAEILKFLKSLRMRLRAAKEEIVDFSAIGKTCKF